MLEIERIPVVLIYDRDIIPIIFSYNKRKHTHTD